MAAIRRVFAINGVAVDLDRNTATFDGSEIRIEPKIAALLQYFIDHQGETLTREALIAAVWDGAYGADHSLTNAVSQLRKLLDRSGTGEKAIETVPKKGYRFVGVLNEAANAVVNDAGDEAVAHHQRADAPSKIAPRAGASGSGVGPDSRISAATRRWIGAVLAFSVLIIAAAGLKGAPDRRAPTVAQTLPVLAVLPFEDRTRAEGGDFADGFSSELTDGFTRNKRLQVISSWSAFRLRDNRDDAAKVRDQLGADYIVVGTIDKSSGAAGPADATTVSVDLLAAPDGERLWSKTFSAAGDDLQGIKAKIISDVSDALAAPTAPITSQSASDNAYRTYLRGVVDQRKGDVDGLLQAKSLFEAAVRSDPNFAQAHARLAQVYLALGRRDRRRRSA